MTKKYLELAQCPLNYTTFNVENWKTQSQNPTMKGMKEGESNLFSDYVHFTLGCFDFVASLHVILEMFRDTYSKVGKAGGIQIGQEILSILD